MVDVMEQLVDQTASPEEKSPAALPSDSSTQDAAPDTSRPAEGGAANAPEKPAEGQTTPDQSTSQSTETEKDWKTEYEKAQKQLEGQKATIKQRDEDYRAQEGRRRKAEQQSAVLLQEKAARVQAVLNDPDKHAEINADPETQQQFIREMVAVEMAQERASADLVDTNAAWGGAIDDLMQHACGDDDGPRMTIKEFKDWQASHGPQFNPQTYSDPTLAVAAAKQMLRGQYFSRYAENVREAEEKDAHEKANRTLAASVPQAAASASVSGKQKSIADAYWDDLRPAGSKSAADVFVPQ